MFTLIVTEKGGQPKRMDFEKDEITIGRVPGNDIVLPKGNVSKRHSRVVRQDGRYFVVDLKSTNGTYLNGRRITTPSVIRPGDKIYVGDFVVMVDLGEGVAAGDNGAPEELEPEPSTSNFPPAEAEGSQPPPDSSNVEALPLDEEPPESSPPPPMSGGGRPPAATVMSMPGNMGASRPPMSTQPLGSSAAAALGSPPANAPPAGGPGPRPTQPPPRGPALPSRPSPAQAISSPRVGVPPMGGPPMGAPPGPRPPGPLGPPAPFGGPPAMMPLGAGSRPAMGASPAPLGVPGGPPVMDASRKASGPGIQASRATETTSMGNDDDLDSQATSFPPMSPPSSASAAASGTPAETPTTPPPALGSAPAPAVSALGPPPTLNIVPAVVDAVIQSHRASAKPGAEPTPPGREYATALAELVAEAKSNGAPVIGDRMADPAARVRVRTVVEGLARRREGLPAGVTPDRLIRDATAELAGAGAIESALEEPEVTTVVIESSGRVLVGRGDALGPSPFWFSGDAAVVTAVERLLHAAGVARRDEPVVEAVIADGARLTAVLPPVARSGPTVVVERPARRAATLVDLVAHRMLSQQAANMIAQALNTRRNVIVSGPRGTGRTSVLTALAAAVGSQDRCVVVEDRPELAASVRDATVIDARGDWKRAMTLAGALHPQRLVVGDGNDASASALVAQFVTGFEGALCVAEGPSPGGALNRLATLAAAGGTVSREEAVARLAVTRPFVIHTARFADGSCRVVAMGEARGGDGGLSIEEAFSLRLDGVSAAGKIEATLVATGVIPAFVGAEG